MRLLHTTTYQLTTFFGSLVPPFVILSHTWGAEEVSFQNIASLPTASLLSGFRKIKLSCAQATNDGFGWIWIDTCCIDKTSSAELSEAINSMFKWYQKSAICYAFLEDVSIRNGLEESFRKSRWFTRGWTLQELIAPQTVEFYDLNWNEIGTKRTLQIQIAEISGINHATLGGQSLSKRCIAERMSWASTRQTTREEDMAYCLMGLFDINMPMLYGEGGVKAFRRLQEEILKTTSNDYSILAWRSSNAAVLWNASCGILAASAMDFTVSRDDSDSYSSLMSCPSGFIQESSSDSMGNVPFLTSKGLNITLATWQPALGPPSGYYVVLLDYVRGRDGHLLCIDIRQNADNPSEYSRVYTKRLIFIPPELFASFSPKRMYLSTQYWVSQPEDDSKVLYYARVHPSSAAQVFIKKCHPQYYNYVGFVEGERSSTGARVLHGILECWSETKPLFLVAFGVQHNIGEPWCEGFLIEDVEGKPSHVSDEFKRLQNLILSHPDGPSFPDRNRLEIGSGEHIFISIRNRPSISARQRSCFQVEVSLRKGAQLEVLDSGENIYAKYNFSPYVGQNAQG